MNHPDSANGKIDAQVASSICACGSSKTATLPFCQMCYRALRIPKNNNIMFGLARGGYRFYQAFEEAIEYLKEIGEIRI